RGAGVRPRVGSQRREVEGLAQDLGSGMGQPGADFASPDRWQADFDGEVERVVLLWAHVEDAWVEAKETGDDDVRRAAKAPRKRLDEARALLDKLHACAADNGVAFSQGTVWRKIERRSEEHTSELQSR